MIFILHKDKTFFNGQSWTTWAEAGPYQVVRVFDADRVIVDLNAMRRIHPRSRILTLLRIADGELKEGSIEDVSIN